MSAFKRAGAIAALLLGLALPASADDAAPMVLHLLDYIAVDYPGAVEDGRVKSEDEYREMTEFSGQVATLLATLPSHPSRKALEAQAAELAARIARKEAPDAVARTARELHAGLVRAYDVQVAPRRAPDAARGATLFAQHCATCHGAEGRGDGPAAKGLDPAPPNFHDRERMAQRSAFALYNTVTLGVQGTAMPSFKALSEDDRWALAYHVAGFTQSRKAPASPLDFASASLAESLAAYRVGDRGRASQLAIRSYLEGFELIEKPLSHLDPALTQRGERAMMEYRRRVQAGAAATEAESQAREVEAILAEARERLAGPGLSAPAIFTASLLILLREGLEAVLVLAAIFAFLGKSGRSDAKRYVHAGWIGALALGALTWVVSSRLIAISGASREVTEGITALISAVMLLYVGFWLHDKTHAAAWQRFIGARVGGALDKGTVWTLAAVSFLAVYREVFETVLFYQALASQAGPEGHAALVAGVAVGGLALAALAWAILRWSARLPIGAFFTASALLLAVLAVVFTGQGIAALQEASWIDADTFGSLRVPILGIFPTSQSLAAQAAVAALIVAVVAWSRRRIPSRPPP